MGINPGAHIPDNGIVRVKDLSALGEQYLDFEPATSGRPFLRAGSVIAASRIILPTPIGTSLINLGILLNSINPQDLQTVESFLTTAFIGTGPSLRTIIVTGQQLFDSLVAAQPETVNLVVDGRTDLDTLKATDGDLTTFTQGLAQLTEQLKQLEQRPPGAYRQRGRRRGPDRPVPGRIQLVDRRHHRGPEHRLTGIGDVPAGRASPLPGAAGSGHRPGQLGFGGTGQRRAELQHRQHGLPVHSGDRHTRPDRKRDDSPARQLL
jgi:hypothetical protein